MPTLRSLVRTIALWLVLTTGLVVRDAAAQDPPEPFETVTVGAHLDVPLLQELSAGWDEQAGLSIAAEFPFYVGILEFGGRIHRHRRTSSEVPQMSSGFLFLGWRSAQRLPRGFILSGGPQVGTLVMLFDDDELAPNGKVEQELGLYLTARLEHAVGRNWSARIFLSYGTILLSDPLRSAYLGAGLARTITTPGWLREVLQ